MAMFLCNNPADGMSVGRNEYEYDPDFLQRVLFVVTIVDPGWVDLAP